MRGRHVQGADRQRGVHAVSEQHVFGGHRLDKRLRLQGVSSESDFGGRERAPGLLLLRAGVLAPRGPALVPGLHARDVQHAARAAGVLELLDRAVLGALDGDHAGGVPALPGGAVVAGGEREL